MKTLSTWCIAAMTAAFLWLLLTEVSAAQNATTPEQPLLTLDPVPASVVGERPVVVAHLVDPDNEPIAGAQLILYVNDEIEDRASTTDNGSVVLRVRTDLAAGTYDIEVAFDGSTRKRLDSASARSQLEIRPGTLNVQVVPAIAGVSVAISTIDTEGISPASASGAMTLTTETDGFARFPIAKGGRYHVDILLPWASPDSGVKAEFSRWMDNVFTPERDVEYRDGAVFQAGFEIHYLVSYEFTNLQGDPVDPDDITSVTFKNTMGEKIERTDVEEMWVKGGRVTRRRDGLEETQLQYSVEEVIVDGTSVVNRSQYRFTPAQTRSWTIPLLYYSVTLSSQDAIFSSPIGTSAEVTSPNGTVRVVSLDENGTASLPLLPRGEYRVKVRGGGYSPQVPVALSRDQYVVLKVISVLDAVVVVGLGTSVAFGLLLIGRWRAKRRKVRRRMPVPDQSVQPS